MKPKNTVQKILKQRNITVSTTHFLRENELHKAIQPHQNTIDVVLTLRDGLVQANMSKIVELCSQYNITVFASDFASVEAGAALGFGDFEDKFGITGAIQALLVLDGYKKPWQLPIMQLKEKNKIHLNTATMQQGITLCPNILLLIEHTEIFCSEKPLHKLNPLKKN